MPKSRCQRVDSFTVSHPTRLERGLPIGSGEIESAHRYVIQERLKLPGAWWTPANVEAMLALRLNRANREWDNLLEWRRNRGGIARILQGAHHFESHPNFGC